MTNENQNYIRDFTQLLHKLHPQLRYLTHKHEKADKKLNYKSLPLISNSVYTRIIK